MHKLTRPFPEPSALRSARGRFSGRDDFSSVETSERTAIRRPLLEMQNRRCAYCECTLRDGRGHIEHFRKQSLYPDKIFAWENLFYSCCNEMSCGKRKDRVVRYREQNEQLIDPCEENPEDFFVFDATGKIAVRSTCSPSDKQRAEFTINAFGLNEPNLIQARKNNLRRHQWMRQYPSQLQENLSLIAAEPFITSIYHYFGQRLTPEN